MVSPTLIVFAVRGALRLAQAGARAYEQAVIDGKLAFPDAEGGGHDMETAVIIYFGADHPDLIDSETGDLRDLWNHETGEPKNEEAITELWATMITLEAAKFESVGGRKTRAEGAGAVVMIEQWAEGRGPASPYAIIAVTLVDIGLEYIGAHPETVGLSGNGGKLISGIAARISSIIPDDTDGFDAKLLMTDRLVGIVLRASLESLSEHSGAIIGEEHLQEFVVESLKPVIAKLPAKHNEQMAWEPVFEALSGPAFRAALGVMAKQPEAFFGKKYESSKAAGAVVQKLLLDAKEKSLEEVLSSKGMEELVRSAVSVVSEKPELFITSVDGGTAEFKRDLLRNIADAIVAAPFPFNGDVAASIAAGALDALNGHAMSLLDVDKDWENVAGWLTDQVLGGIKDAVTEQDAKKLSKMFTKDELREFGRIFLTEVGKNPGMIIGGLADQGTKVRSDEIRNLVAAVTGAMAKAPNLLLSGQDWLKIAEVAAKEVARNPGAFVGINGKDTAGSLLNDALTAVLNGAATGFSGTHRKQGNLLFGETLRDAMIATMHAASINLTTLAEEKTKKLIQKLIEKLEAYAKGNQAVFGSKEFLRVYKSVLPEVLEKGGALLDGNGNLTVPSEDQIKKILERRIS